MFDITEKIGSSTIQHGSNNARIYLMKLASEDAPQIIDHLEDLAKFNGYSKFFAKISEDQAKQFIDRGFKTEAKIPGFYNGKEDAWFLSKYYDKKRASVDLTTSETIKSNIETALKKSKSNANRCLPDGFEFRKLEERDAEDLAELYKVVFKTYPFPIHDPSFIKQVMKDYVIYFGIFDGDRLVSASSCETDEKSQNVEMTDFATHPEYRGKSFGTILLNEMEKYMRKHKYLCTYTIARAMSAAMNITFAKLGYKFSGTLINNTNISGKIESMNVWYKSLI